MLFSRCEVWKMKERESNILKETKHTLVIAVIECMGHRAQSDRNSYRQRCKRSKTDSRSKHELPLAYHILH